MPQSGETLLAIHKDDYARAFAARLNSEGITASIAPISGLEAISGIYVHSDELPGALRIIESPDFYIELSTNISTGTGSQVLVPVDFSPYSINAVKVAAQFAARLNATPRLLHCYMSPAFQEDTPIIVDGTSDDTSRMVESFYMGDEASAKMKNFRAKIKELQIKGEIPVLPIAADIDEGIPEEIILEQSRIINPSLIVMATRGIHRKAADLIGSVTAEVMDSCRVPIFTVPDEFPPDPVYQIRKVAFICSLSASDIFAMQRLNEIFPDRDYDITLLPISDKLTTGNVSDKLQNLINYFSTRYPNSRFSSEVIPGKSFREGFEDFADKSKPGMIVVPNRKRNALTRLFNPGIAHKILFQADVPMLVIPV